MSRMQLLDGNARRISEDEKQGTHMGAEAAAARNMTQEQRAEQIAPAERCACKMEEKRQARQEPNQ
jgi:hypothetical protein